MTENEAIKELKEAIDCCTSGEDEHFKEALGMGILALEEIQYYRAIGTVEELKALKEKSEAKKVLYEHIPKTSWTKEVSHYLCPSCRGIFSFGGKPYCSNCGQKLDWQ